MVINSDRPVSHNAMNKSQLIINAAIKVFAQDGLDKGKIAAIAKEAGIGKGTVYEYFRSKEDIFKAIEQTMFSEISSAFESVKSSSLTPSKKIKRIMTLTLDMSIEMGDAMLIITELWAQTSRGHYHGATSSQLIAFYEEYKLEIESILDDGIKAGEFRKMNKEGVATMLMAFLDGMGLQIIIMNNPEAFNRIKSEAIESFMLGILK